jgi:hypothetical protein
MLTLSLLLALASSFDPVRTDISTVHPCRAANDTSALYVQRLKRAYEDIDSATVVTRGEPFARGSAISFVSDSAVCASAVAAYHQAGGGPISSAYVIQLGPSGWAVFTPDNDSGEFTMIYLFNSSWQFKTMVGG